MENKISNSQLHNDTLPFTIMSKDILNNWGQFSNVYHKGALICFCLDIKLKQLSDGKYGIQELMTALSNKFGKDKPFDDNELFDIISTLTFPAIRTFFSDYVDGKKHLPYKEIFDSIGVSYELSIINEKRFKLGLMYDYNKNNKRYIVHTSGILAFGKIFGFIDGDEIVSINNTVLSPKFSIHF